MVDTTTIADTLTMTNNIASASVSASVSVSASEETAINVKKAMELSKEQKTCMEKYIRGDNIFITGPGGSGKSELIKRIYHHARSQWKTIHVCAMTGCAAVLLNCKAKTLHSWSGVGLGNGTVEQMVAKIQKKTYLKSLWKDTDILVVDEVSMLSLHLFDALNQIGQNIRGNRRPFGGIQLIFSGDFFQLPPIGDKERPDTQRFCFESELWNTVFPVGSGCQIQLIQIFRQTDDIYSSLLNQIRRGKMKRKSVELLLQHVGRPYDAGLIVEPTKLYPTRYKVENINNTKMASLKGEEKKFTLKQCQDLEMTRAETIKRCQYSDKDIQIELDFIANNIICEKEMKVKVGSQVMCIVNIGDGESGGLEICNGSQGIVASFCPNTGYPYVQFNNGVRRTMSPHTWVSDKIPGIGVSQIPLILAWALTIHKSQGATLDVAEIDVGSDVFECGQTYVALSRVKSLQGLYLKSFDVNKIFINAKVDAFYNRLS